MPAEPVWLDINEIIETHEEQIELFGGPPGTLDLGLVESALDSARNLYEYEGETDVLTLAVKLGVGIARNHGFVDGNKRTGAMALLQFLAINGYYLTLDNDTRLGRWFTLTVAKRSSEADLVAALDPYVMPFFQL